MNDKTLKGKPSSHYAVFDLIEEQHHSRNVVGKEKEKSKYHNK